MKTIKELMTTGIGTQGTLLLERKIYDTLIDAAAKKLVGRSQAAFIVPPAGIPGSSVDINTVDVDSMKVYAIAEGAAIPLDTVAYSTANLRPAKYGVRIAITKEMMEDAKWDLMAHNIKVAGIEMAENEDSLILTVLDGATNVVSGGAAITIANITRAMQYLEDNDYTSTTLIVGPEVANDIRNIATFVESDKLGTREMFDTGFIGRIFGMDVIQFSAAVGTTTRAYVLDKNHAFIGAEKRPVTVERYDDATHDLSGASVTQRVVFALLRDLAVARITTT